MDLSRFTSRVNEAIDKDVNLRDVLVASGGVLAGGFLRSVADGTSIRDADIFVPSQRARQAAREVLTTWGRLPRIVVSPVGQRPIDRYAPNPRMIGTQYGLKIIPVPWATSIRSVIERFDITVSQAGVQADGTVEVGPRFASDVASRNFQLAGKMVVDPVGTLARSFRYRQKGYTIDPTSYERLVDLSLFVARRNRRSVRQRAQLSMPVPRLAYVDTLVSSLERSLVPREVYEALPEGMLLAREALVDAMLTKSMAGAVEDRGEPLEAIIVEAPLTALCGALVNRGGKIEVLAHPSFGTDVFSRSLRASFLLPEMPRMDEAFAAGYRLAGKYEFYARRKFAAEVISAAVTPSDEPR